MQHPTCYKQCQGIVSSYRRGLCHTWKMTFPAVRVTSSQGLVLGLAPRATGAAVLDKNPCCNCSAPPRAGWCVWRTLPGLWATSDGVMLPAIPCSWAMAHSTFCLDSVCAGNLVRTVGLNHRRSCVLVSGLVKSEILVCGMKKYFEN